MAKPPTSTRFLLDGYPDAPEWFATFLVDLNTSWNQVVGALSSNLTRGENVTGKVYENLSVVVPGVYTPDTAPFPILLPMPATGIPKAIWVGKVTVVTGSIPTAANQIFWEVAGDGRKIRVRYITGLAINSSYKLNLVAE